MRDDRMNNMRFCAYVLCLLSLVYAHQVAAAEQRSCEERASDLREYFAAKYIDLDAQCAVKPCEGNCEPPAKPQPEPLAEGTSASPDFSPPEISEDGESGAGSGSSGGSVGACGSPLSPECAASYDALNTEVATAWDMLYAECPDIARPVPVGGGGNGDSREDGLDATGPVFRAPTSAELYETVKILKKRLSRTRKSLRRARANTKECRSSGRPR